MLRKISYYNFGNNGIEATTGAWKTVFWPTLPDLQVIGCG
jgi:hypothetical protein